MEALWVAVREQNPPRPIRDRMDPLRLPDHVLLRQYRLPRRAILQLANILKDELQRSTRRSSPLPVALQVMVALRFFASGTFQMVIGGTVGVSQSSVSRIVRDVSNALSTRARQFIKFPATAAECVQTKQQLFEIAGFPNVLGVVDGTHIAIKAPKDEEDIYVNRKNFHSINVQVICDATLRVTDLVARWPGQTHDSFILMNSGIGVKFSDGEMPDGWLLGDSGYALRPWLMTPLLHPGTPAERRYTSAQTKTRNIVERCIGVVKSRFRCIDRSGGVLQYTPERACKIITSVFILHNICQMYRLPIPNIPDDHPEEDGHDHPAPCETGIQARNDLIRRRFTQAN